MLAGARSSSLTNRTIARFFYQPSGLSPRSDSPSRLAWAGKYHPRVISAEMLGRAVGHLSRLDPGAEEVQLIVRALQAGNLERARRELIRNLETFKPNGEGR